MFDPMSFDPRDLDAALREVDKWQAGFEERAAQANAMAGRVAELSATARSRSGLVSVTVDGSARVTGLRLDDRELQHLSAEEVEREILQTIQAAYAELTERVRQAAAETLGEESELGRAIVASFANPLTPPGDSAATAWRGRG